MEPNRIKSILADARAEVGKVIIGQHDVIEKALIVIFTGNHALIEGVPGVAKTLLVRTLAHVLGMRFLAHPVHPGPHAFGHHGYECLQPPAQRVLSHSRSRFYIVPPGG